ncbi:MAG TPA: TolC family protein [Ignavibacteria bacterium]
MIKKIFLIVIIPYFLLSQNFKKYYSINECINTALKNNYSIKIYEAKIKGNEAKYRDVMTLQYPQLKLYGSYLRLSDIDPFQVTLPSPISKTIEISPVLLNNTNFKLSLQQPIFTGGKISNSIDLAEHSYFSSLSSYNQEKNDLITNIKIGYYNILKAIKLLENVKENIIRTENHIKDLKHFLELGQITKNELLKVEVQLYNLKSKEVETNNILSLSKMSLNNLMGKDVNEEFDIDTTITDNIEINDLQFYLNEAIKKRPEISMINESIKIAEYNKQITLSNWFPQLYLNANYYYANPNQRIMPNKNKFIDTWDVGISLSFDLWNWGSTSRKVEQSEAQIEEAKSNLSLYTNMVLLEVRQSYLNIIQLKEELIHLNKSYEAAEENYRICKDKFQKGYLSSTELLDAEVALLTSKNNYINGLIDYNIAFFKLEKACGNINY